jgi:hypothetical protein
MRPNKLLFVLRECRANTFAPKNGQRTTLYALMTCVLLLASAVTTLGQRSYFYLAWDVNQSLSNTTWLDETSTRGGKFGFRKFIGDERNISVGIDLNWNYFQNYKPTETFYTENGAVTTDYFNNIFQVAAAVSGQYYFPIGDKQVFYPYLGIGLGANRNRYTVSYNIYEDEESAFGFLARPEAGILVRIGERRRFGLTAAVHYDYSTNASDNYGYNNFMTAGFQIGVVSLQW